MKQVLVLLFVLALFVLATVLNAQTVGTLEGTVIDERGEAVPGATIGILETNRGAVTNAEGEFKVAGLKAGIYQVQVTSLRTDTVRRTVSIRVNATSCESFYVSIRMQRGISVT